MVDVYNEANIDEFSTAATGYNNTYVKETYCHCALVQKETGSNGQPWDARGVMNQTQSTPCNGFSFCLAFCANIQEGSDGDSIRMQDYEMLLGTIAKACLKPENLPGFKKSRPRKVLFRSHGFMLALEQKLSSMGIDSVAVADKKLVASMVASFSKGNDTTLGGSALANAAQSSSTSNGEVNMRSVLRAHLMKRAAGVQDGYYVSEDRVPLGRWRPDPELDRHTPKEWFATPPQTSEYRARMLWGWRTNMELAVECNDVDKIKDICNRYPANDVKDHVERRILLTRAAGKGFALSCRALIKYAGAAVDGVRDKDNKKEWVPLQQESGDKNGTKGATPLGQAAQNGHGSVVRVLLKHGANLNYAPFYSGGTPLHFAVAGCHLDIVERLVDAGADVHVEDTNNIEPSTPVTLCQAYLESGQPPVEGYKRILKVLNGAESRRHCAACNEDNPKQHCPCGLEHYCGKECQKLRWPHHKAYHKEEMALKKV
jgi:hypothetical protein